MPLKFSMSTVTVEDPCSLEDAIPLLQFLQLHQEASVDLSPCVHLPSALLQVLLAERPNIIALPVDVVMRHWLLQVLGAATNAAHPLQSAPPPRFDALNP